MRMLPPGTVHRVARRGLNPPGWPTPATWHWLIRYLLWVGAEAVHEAARGVLHSVLDEQRAEELMRSYGEQLIERGRWFDRALNATTLSDVLDDLSV